MFRSWGIDQIPAMGSYITIKPVKLIASIIFKDDDLLPCVEEELESMSGCTESTTGIIPFDFTDYYHPEMGQPLKRKMVCFKELVDPENIALIKVKTNEIEDKFSVDGLRKVNIDPGYVTEAKLVLLTTKDYMHRIYLSDKIFAEITLYYQDGRFKAWPWTYPDYASEELISYFEGVRGTYMENINKRRNDSK